MTEAKRLSRAQIRTNVLLVNRRLNRIRQLNKKDVPFFCRFGDGIRVKSVGLRLLTAFRRILGPAATDDHLESAVARIRRLRLSLDAVTDDGDGLALED